MTETPHNGETPQEHEARMKKWKEQDEASIVAGKLLTLHGMPELEFSPFWSWKTQAKIVKQSPRLFAVFVIAESSLN